MPNALDRQLARRVVRKEDEAFEEFFRSLFPRVYRFCRSRLDAPYDDAEVEDIVQETMLKALRNLHGYRGDASLFTWVCQICRNEIAAWHRRRSLLDLGGEQEAGAGVDDPAGDEFERRSTEEAVHLVLDRLPADYAVALEQKYVMGRSVTEVARELGRGRVATQSLLARARRAFARHYRDLRQHNDGAAE